VARLMLDEAFTTALDANTHGLEMGKKWIDEKDAKSKSLQSVGVMKKVASK
jgi:hypothetical protein